MLCTPLSGSRDTKWAALTYGALSQPGVEMGTGMPSMPRPRLLSCAPEKTTSCTGACEDGISTGSTGWVLASAHRALMSVSSSHPRPMR